MSKEHDDDLLPQNIDGRVNAYVVETWSNTMSPKADGPSHDVWVAYVASSHESAIDWCRENADYCGVGDDWHWRIHRFPMNYDPTEHVMPDEESWHFTRDMKPCNSGGCAEEEEVDEAQEKLEETIDTIRWNVGEIESAVEEMDGISYIITEQLRSIESELDRIRNTIKTIEEDLDDLDEPTVCKVDEATGHS